MYIFSIILILIASVLIVLAVLAQNPKSGMAANFGASNQVMGARQTSDFLEKFTWTLAIAIVVLSLVATMTMPSGNIASSKSELEKSIEKTGVNTGVEGMIQNQVALPSDIEALETEPAAAE
ncbi:MAG: preprotein translocase subunit SecG [Rikenellaceae bacterium]